MRRGVALYGATEEALSLVPLLEGNPDVEIAGIYDPDADAARSLLGRIDPAAQARLGERVGDDPALLGGPLHAVIDAGSLPAFTDAFPDAHGRGVQVVSPLTARLLFAYGAAAPDRKGELLQALREVVESVNLTVDADELFARMLEIAMGVTGADGGSLMLVDPARRELRIRVAVGVEPELWPKIRVPLGEGVAGRVAADARPLKIRGPADRSHFRLLRERFDVESALCVPLVHEAQVLGVLNLHHSSRPEAFDDDDLAFAEELGSLDAQIISRAQEHEALRRDASRYAAVRQVRHALSGAAPLLDRLGDLCRTLAERIGGGVVCVHLHDPDERELRFAATSLAGGALGGEYRVALGEGLEGRAAQSREPVFLHAPDGTLGFAAVPLEAGSDLVGVLSVQGGGSADPGLDASGPALGAGRALEETLLEIAAAVADEVAQAEREARMTSRATKVSAINEAGIKLVSARDPAEVARLSTSSGALILEADHAVLRLQDPETRRYVIRSYYGAADGRTQERLFRLDKNVSVDTLKARAPRLVRHVRDVESYAAVDSGVRSVLAAPLAREGRAIGTLALYDKVLPDAFQAGSFNDDDFQIFTRWVSYVERALDGALFWSRARQHRNFDEETGLPNAEYLERRIDQEIARLAGRSGALCLAVCRIENLDEVRRGADALHAERVVLRTAEALRAHLRDFDVLARTGDGEFSALLPDPGSADERVTALARAVADEVAKDERLNRPVRLALAFGHALHPDQAADRATLRSLAAEPRIRLL